jgi:hypothetical protein
VASGPQHLHHAHGDLGTLAAARGAFKKSPDGLSLRSPNQFVIAFPTSREWQLLVHRCLTSTFSASRLSPAFFAHGLELLTPDRSQVSTGATIDLSIKNPRGVFLLASYSPKALSPRSTAAATSTQPCAAGFPARVATMSNVRQSAQYGTYVCAGSVEVNAAVTLAPIGGEYLPDGTTGGTGCGGATR